MKYLLAVLVLVVTSLFLLTACGKNSTSYFPAVPTSTSFEASVSQDIDITTSVLEEFMNAVNRHEVSTALDLFNDSAVLTTVDETGLGTTLPQTDVEYTYSSKAAIAVWLEFETSASLQIVPIDYKIAPNTVILRVVFNYPNRVEDVRMDAQTEGSRFSRLYVFIEKSNQLPKISQDNNNQFYLD